MSGLRARWVARLEATLPPRADVIARNAAITATYARWYLEHPALFKWAGMAVTASFEAGLYLARLVTPRGAQKLVPAAIRRSQAELICFTNNGVFDDIAWTHAAYVAPDGGFAAVEAALTELLPSHGELLEGFRQLDAGRRLLAHDGARAEALVWSGTRALLRHEQLHTVQPFFARFHPAFRRVLSAAAGSDFRLGDARVQQAEWPRFTRDMLRQRRALLRATGTWLPDIARFEHRWQWLDDVVLPCWQRVETARQHALLERMRELAAGAR